LQAFSDTKIHNPAVPLLLGLERGLKALGERLPGALLPDRLHHHLLLHRGGRHPTPRPPSRPRDWWLGGAGGSGCCCCCYRCAAAGSDRDLAGRRGRRGEVRERGGRCCPRIETRAAARPVPHGGGVSLGAGEKRERGGSPDEVAAWSPSFESGKPQQTMTLEVGAAPRSVRFPRGRLG